MGKPVYIKIKEELLKEIAEKKPHEPIESERALSMKYKASRMTVRKTIDILVSEGYLYRNKNIATCVSERSIVESKQPVDIISDDIYDHKMLYFNVKSPDRELAKILEVDDDEVVVRMVKSNIREGKVHSIDDIYYVRDIVNETDIKSVSAILGFSKHVKQGFLKQRFVPIIIPPNYANALNVKIGTPIIMVESIISGIDKKPIAFIKTYNNTNEKPIEIVT